MKAKARIAAALFNRSGAGRSKSSRAVAPRAFLPGAKGSGAPSLSSANGTGAFSARPARTTALACLIAMAAALALTAAPASAGLIHPYKSQLTGTPAGPFSELRRIAVDPANQDLYVADNDGRVDIFNSAGVFQAQITQASLPVGSTFAPESVAVSDKTGDVYVTSGGGENPGRVYVFDATGVYVTTLDGSTTPQGSFSTGMRSVAVDQSSGDFYVADEFNNVVDRFNSANEYQSQLTLSGGPEGVAVDSSGDLYVTESGGTNEFNSTGTQILHIGAAGHAVAVDSEGNIYVEVAEFDSSGALVNETRTFVRSVTSPNANFGNPVGVAVNAAGDMYISDPQQRVVDVFGPNLLVPGVSGEAATSVSDSGATLHGTVNPEGTEVTSCEFQYRTAAEAEFQHSIACSPATPYTGTSDVAVEATLSGLAANTTYRYRLVASNANGAEGGAGYGPEESFKTPGSPRIGDVSAEVNPTEKAGQTTATLQASINPDGRETTYTFEYGEATSYGTSVPLPPAAIGSGEAFVPVTVELSGLKVGTTYHYRLTASNEYGSVDSTDQTFTTLPSVLIESESASAVSATSATLEAQVNPLGSSSTCEFQYVDAAGFQSSSYEGASSVPCPAALGEGEVGVSTSIHLQGLTAHTTYHYRAVATNGLGITEGADRTFTTQSLSAAPALPDGRALEMVSPPDKRGALLEGLNLDAALQAAAAGDAITYFSAGPTESEPQGHGEGPQLLSRRGPTGWSTEDIGLPHGQAIGTGGRGAGEFFAFSADLSRALVEPPDPFKPFSPLAACTSAGCLPETFPEATAYTDYIRHNSTCAAHLATCYEPLLTGAAGYADVPPGTEFGEPFSHNRHEEFTGAAPDLNSVVLASEVGLTPGVPQGRELYEWSAAAPPTARLQLISVLPQGEGGGPATGNPRLGNNTPLRVGGGWRPVSTDGSRVFWTNVLYVVTNGAGSNPLYMRDTVKGETIRLDSGGGGAFQAASSDGSRAFFTEAGHLYVCEIVEQAGGDACHLTDLTPELNGESVPLNEFIAGTSDDGSSVYFVAGQSFYLSHYDGTQWATTFIATLSPEDEHDWTATLHGSFDRTTTRVSPDGRYLAFMSGRSLTGYDNSDALTGRPDQEVYLYDSRTNRLVCASCNPTGARPLGVEVGKVGDNVGAGNLVDIAEVRSGDSAYSSETGIAANLPGGVRLEADGGSLYWPRLLSNSGRLFFNSSDALVPSDTNGNEDVYQYEPPGVGDCTESSPAFSPASQGCLGLISSGTSGEESGFLDASENGNDSFFLTASKLSKQDVDTSLDVYDAHACSTESPCPPPPPPPTPACEGDACQQPAEAANDPTPGSLTFNGAGNVREKPATCPKGKVRKHGRCIKKHTKKRAHRKHKRAAAHKRGGHR